MVGGKKMEKSNKREEYEIEGIIEQIFYGSLFIALIIGLLLKEKLPVLMVNIYFWFAICFIGYIVIPAISFNDFFYSCLLVIIGFSFFNMTRRLI